MLPKLLIVYIHSSCTYISYLHLILLMVTRFEKFKASFWCLFKTFIPLKMFQTFRHTKRLDYFTNTFELNSNEISIKKKKKKKFHEFDTIIDHSTFFRRKFSRNSLLPANE